MVREGKLVGVRLGPRSLRILGPSVADYVEGASFTGSRGESTVEQAHEALERARKAAGPARIGDGRNETKAGRRALRTSAHPPD